MQQTIGEWFRNIRLKGVPLVAVSSLDLEQSQRELVLACKALAEESGEASKAAPRALLRWDCVTGLTDIGAVQSELNQPEAVRAGVALTGLSSLAESVPHVCVMHRIDEALLASPDTDIVQGIANLRGLYERYGCTLVLLGSSNYVPPTLAQDIVMYESPLPSMGQYEDMIRRQCQGLGVVVAEDEATHACQALRGLSMFAARQQVALSLRKSGIDLDALWEHKRQVVNQSRYLSLLYQGLPDFSVLGGNEGYKGFVRDVRSGEHSYGAVLWLDEIEKMLAGAEGDTSGVSQDFMGYLLYWLDRVKSLNVLAVGPPGTSKSWSAQCTAGEMGVPCLRGDLGACKASLVGESERNIRQLTRMAEAIAGDHILVFATCNSTAHLPAALMRRFRVKFFFDLPDEQERLAIWRIQRQRNGLPLADEYPQDTGWVAADIASCCELARELRLSCKEAARYIVPVGIQDREGVAKLQLAADGRYLSSAYAGVYRLRGQEGERAMVIE